MSRRAWVAAFLTVVASCAEPTSILVEVTSTRAVPGDVDALRFVVTGRSSGAVVDSTYALDGPFPHTVSIRPGEVESAEIDVEVIARLGDAEVTRRRASATFESGREVRVTIDLDGASPDAGMTDAGVDDAGTDDAGPLDGGGLDAGPLTFPVGGTVTGLEGSGLVLANGGETLAIDADGAFTFPTEVADGATFEVTVATQPSEPEQACRVVGGAGTVRGGPVTSVVVSCADDAFVIGGTVSGLEGAGLRLANGGETISVSADGAFAFPTTVGDGASYAVTVSAQPSGQTCAVANGEGTVAGADVTSVAVTCARDAYTVGGTVTGLEGTGLTLGNGATFVNVSADGAFTFPGTVESGEAYSVTVLTQPSAPAQTCVVTNGAGTVTDADVTDVLVTCTTRTFTVGGTVSGLAGTVVLANGGDSVSVSSAGDFTFPTPVASGASYAVTITTQPSGQTCSVSSGTGTVGAADVTSVRVTCSTDTYTIGGTVSGLAGTGLVLRNNGGDPLSISGNGSFTFSAAVASGGGYAVTVATQPSAPAQRCAISNGSGTATANVTNVQVTCQNVYEIRGTVSGLSGSGLVLRNAGENLAISGNGAFAFPTRLPTGASYAVTVQASPSGPTQSCAVTNGSGTIGTADVTNVAVSCTTSTFTIGGTVSGLAGSGLRLRNNGGDEIAVSSNGAFTFPTRVPSGGSYSVAVQANPTMPWQTCAVTNGNGPVTSANVTSVVVACTTNRYTVGGTVVLLSGAGLRLRNNGGDELAIAANGPFTFSTSVASGASYAVSIQAQPSGGGGCVVLDGSGTVAGANVTDVVVRCGDRRVFVTSTVHASNLGGLDGADAVCQTHADAAGLGGTYRAWLSDDTGSPSTRFVRSTTPYVLVDGTRIADDWTQLTTTSLSAAISLDENGDPPPSSATAVCTQTQVVWSSTNRDGTLAAEGRHCARWTGGGTGAGYGYRTETNNLWALGCNANGSPFCTDPQYRAPLYCFEQ